MALLLLSFPAALTLAAPQPPRDKTVWAYDGGIMLATDGLMKGGPCIRINGRVTHGSFFENLRREDTSTGTLFRRGNDIITEFPELLHLTLILTDRPCAEPWEQSGPRVFLSKQALESLRIRFYWKRGVTLRGAHGIELRRSAARPIPAFPGEHAAGPQLFEWWLDFDVPSHSVPLTDSLVIIMVTTDGDIVARVAARL